MKLAPHKIHSHQGEEGVILGMLEAMAISVGFYVDVGASDGQKGSNTLILAEKGWYGLAVEAHEGRFKKLETFMEKFPKVGTLQDRITCEKGHTIDEALQKLKAPHELDVFNLDIDGNDYWVWKALSYQPKIVVIEYNCHFGNTESKTIPYDPSHEWGGDSYYGASAKALCDLADRKDYVLVYCMSPANLIFVRRKYAGLFERHKLTDIQKVDLFKPSGKWMITPQ